MKKKFIVGFCFILLTIFSIYVTADCQVSETEFTKQYITNTYIDGNKIDYQLLEAKDFQTRPGGSNGWCWCTDNDFKVYNNAPDISIDVTVEYVRGGAKTSKKLLIKPKNFEIISENICGSFGSCNLPGIESSSINFFIHNSEVDQKIEEKNCEDNQKDCKCVQNFMCTNKQCKPDCNNPPAGKKCCGDAFSEVEALNLGYDCACDFQCKNYLSETKCIQNTCEKILEPRLVCSSNMIKIGKSVTCTISADKILINKNNKFTLGLESSPELIFSTENNCKDVELRRCTEQHSLQEIDNNAIKVTVNGKDYGDGSLNADLNFEIDGKRMKSKPISANFHIFGCGDGIKDQDENKENCCIDIGINPYKFFSSTYDTCENGVYDARVNWSLFGSIALIAAIIFGYFKLKRMKGMKRGK
jgi:hypothetical protein